MKLSSILIIGAPEQQKEEQCLENLFEEIMSEKFPVVEKRKVTQARRVTNKMTPKSPTPKHIIIIMTKVQDKERIWKARRERQIVTYKKSSVRLSSDFSIERHKARKEWKGTYKVMQSKGLNPRILNKQGYHSKLKGK